MSDQETAPWMIEAAKKINRSLFPGQWPPTVVQKIAEIIAAESTAPAPQPANYALALDVVDAIEWIDQNEPKRARDVLAEVRDKLRATPQVTPCDHFWRTVAVNPRWSWFTECEKCEIGAPLEVQAENYVEGTSEQASPEMQTCTRPFPHICQVNTPCNGVPKEAPDDEYGDMRADALRDALADEVSEQASHSTGVSLDGGKTIHSKFKND